MELIGEVADFAELESLQIGDRTSAFGSGGMRSKVAAAEMASEAGIPAVICNGTKAGVLSAAAGGEGERIANELAGARFLLNGDGVLEVEDDGVGPTIVGLFHEAADVDGKNQRRATRVLGGHRQMIPFWMSASMRSSE